MFGRHSGLPGPAHYMVRFTSGNPLPNSSSGTHRTGRCGNHISPSTSTQHTLKEDWCPLDHGLHTAVAFTNMCESNSKYHINLGGPMSRKLSAVVIFSLVLTGCAQYRPIVAEPTQAARADASKGGRDPAKSVPEAVVSLKIYSDFFLQKALELKTKEWELSDVGYGGAIFGVLGGLAKSVEAAGVGALAATGSSMTMQRYQLSVQSKNYRRAADAMSCIRSKIFPNQGLNLDITLINEAIDSIRTKLRTAQLDIELASPDVGQLESAVEKTTKARTAVIQANENLVNAKAKGTFTAEATLLQAAEINELHAQISKCAAAY